MAPACGTMRNASDPLGTPEDTTVPGDYFVVGARDDCGVVSREMARFIESELDRADPPRWMVFVDLMGARVRVLSRWIESASQCSAEQRRFARAFQRARRREARTVPEWDAET